MATNFTQFTSEATPSGDVVLVGHNIAGTGEIKTTISQILSAMNLATSSDATFNKVTVTTNVDLSDGSTITVGDGSGIVDLDGKIKLNEGVAVDSSKPIAFDGGTGLSSNSIYSILKSGVRLEFRSNNTTALMVLGTKKIVVGADSILSFSDADSAAGTPDTAFSRASAGHIQLGNGTLNDTSGTLELSHIILSDGSTITVGGGSGTVTIDGVLDVEEELAVGSGKQLVLDGNLNSVNYSIIKSGSRVEFRTTDSNPVLSLSNHRVVVGGDNILGFSDSDSAAGNPDIAFSRGAAGHMQLGNGTVNDTSGKLELADIVASANIDFTGLPTSDPASAGRLYVDSSAGHVIKVSQG